MQLDERGRQLGEVSRQLCEVGSVGMASAARLYAACNAATREWERESRRLQEGGTAADSAADYR